MSSDRLKMKWESKCVLYGTNHRFPQLLSLYNVARVKIVTTQ